MPNSLGRSGSLFSSRRDSNIGSQSSLSAGSRKSSIAGDWSRKSSIAGDCSRKSSIAGDWKNCSTPPTTPGSLLTQTLSNAVSAATQFRRPSFARNISSASVD